ncbi:DNA mismatch repair protein [Wukongibacter baidiensis]|uniref:MutS family DNA mismatch repair protein n=1 Tax=Wukongibacter baidiensis TaxID=1723361 RepID=UPI003D7F26A3
MANNLQTPKKRYERRKKYYSKMLEKQDKVLKIITNLRLTVALAGIGNMVFLYITNSYSLMLPILAAYMAIFIYLVIKHNEVRSRRNYSSSLYKINDESIKRVDGEWKAFGDIGAEFLDESHSYSEDLDVFGKGSLFQWINITTTYIGRQKLKKYLLAPCKSSEEIHERQEVLSELSGKLWWRQRFMAEGMVISDDVHDSEPLYSFVKEKKNFYLKNWVMIGARVLPIISIILCTLYLMGKVSYYPPVVLLGIQTLILKFKNKERTKTLNMVYNHKENIKSYRKMLEQFEKKHFRSSYINRLKASLVSKEGYTAYQQIDRLERITQSISNRNNAVFIIINILLLWDYQCMISLEIWKRRSGILIETWLDVIGELEALSSLALIKHDNPEWAMPKIIDTSSNLKAENMGHPLLTNKRICNDLKIESPTKILLITGSNMSGKSTLLRTVGLNLLLAYIGAPVCARSFQCPMMEIHTCMRVSDNLEKSISSFYAELLRIKEIVRASKDRPVFFLLDEIFKGTNSEDRHEGAKQLINKLLRDGAIGLVSTHDLELGVLENESNKRIRNYHFQEYYRDNEIYFDYRLKSGISTTRNALYLIKMVGIDD